jgi:SAM-dependent methyltransferase
MSTKHHWETIYQTKQLDQVGWYQADPRCSLELIANAAVPYTAELIDVGGGASMLVDHLVDQGYRHITVLDIAAAALSAAQARLGARAGDVTWLEADITTVYLAPARFNLWHDRAVFHFLVDPAQRAAYIAAVHRALKPGGDLIIATFAPDAPAKCSGLDVVRYAPDDLQHTFGEEFHLVENVTETHITPSGVQQPFVYCRFRRH